MSNNGNASITLSQETQTSKSSSSKSHWKKARNPENQETLNKLIEISTEPRFITKDNYKKLFGKAIKAIKQCDTCIETYDDAIKLNGVGKFLAQLIMKKKRNNDSIDSVVSSSIASNNSDGSKRKKNGNKKKKDIDSSSSTSACASISSISSPNTASRMLKKCTSITSSSSSHTNTSNISRKEITLELTKREADLTRAEISSSSYRTWNTILLLDNREHYANHVQAKLLQEGIECEQRSLPIGDMLWIARGSNHISKVGNEVEIVLGTIVERKTSSDLASSLYGTRYDEQRLRLKYSASTVGINKIIFLIEAKSLKDVNSCSAKTLRSAIESTRIHMGFSILQTESLDHTCKSLKSIHEYIQTKVPSDTPPIIQNNNDNNQHQKYYLYNELKLQIELSRERGTKSVTAIFGAMLKQIDGMSYKKVQGFLNVYPTPYHLYKAANASASQNNMKKFETSIADISLSDKERLSRIGDKVAATIVKIFFTDNGILDDEENDDDASIASYFKSSSSLQKSNSIENGIQEEESILTVPRNTKKDDDKTQSKRGISKKSNSKDVDMDSSANSQSNMEVIELD